MEIIVNSTGALIYVIDLQTYEILYANERCQKEFGQVTGKICYQVLQRGKNAPCNFCPLHQDGHDPSLEEIGTTFEWENLNSITKKHYLFVDRIIEWKDGRKVKVQIGIDITRQKKLEEEMLKEKDGFIHSFETMIDSTIEGIIIYDETKHCSQVNAVAPKIFGYTREEMIGQYALNFIAPSSRELVQTVIKNSNQEPYEALMLRKDGTTFPAILRGRDFNLANQKIRVSAVMDITDIRKKEEEILKLANYDSLTGLPNRLLLKELLDHILKQNRRNKQYNAILFIDLDHFKLVNDTKGHEIGDQVLIETARRLKKMLRESDIVGRLGGDEFVVVVELPEIDQAIAIRDVGAIADNILGELRKPYFIENYDFHLTASIGVVLFANEDHSIDELMKFADSAMYNAKENGRNAYHFFDPELQHMMELKALLIERLSKAVNSNAIVLYYQPQIKAEENAIKIIGVEALVRWNDPLYGMILPGSFIPAAEESGLIIPLGEWILREAMRQLKEWQSDDIKKAWRISVNVSYQQFEKNNFIQLLTSMVEEYQIKPSCVRLELTESLLIKNTASALLKIQTLKSLGFSLSIDDFGTGYSSLSYLKQLPIDELKIDQSFIRDLVEDPNDSIIVETLISIGRKFNLEVIAEGVETKAQYQQLVSMGCKFFQGYLFGKPVDKNELPSVLRSV